MKIPRPLVTFSSQVSLLSFLYSALGLDQYLHISLQIGPRELRLPDIYTLHTCAWVYLTHQCHPTPSNPVSTADWHCPHVLTAQCESMQTGCCWANINHTTGSHGQRGRSRTEEKPPINGSKDCRVTSTRHLSVIYYKPQTVLHLPHCRMEATAWSAMFQSVQNFVPYPLRYGNRRYSAPYIHFCNDFDAQNISECLKMGVKQEPMLCHNEDRTCENEWIIFLCMLPYRYMDEFEYCSTRVYG